MATRLVLLLLEMLSALLLLLGQLAEVAQILQSHTAAMEIEAKRKKEALEARGCRLPRQLTTFFISGE